MPTQYLIFNSEITEKNANALTGALVDAFNDTNVDQICIGFSSPGGNISYGVGVHYAIKASPKPIAIHALGAVDSIGVAIFCAAKKRSAIAGSRFYFHSVRRYLTTGNYDRQQILDTLVVADDDEKRLAGIWKGHFKLEDAELSALFEGEHAHDCDWALAHGLIEAIGDFYIPPSSIGHIRNVA